MSIDIESLRGMKLFEGLETPPPALTNAAEERYSRGQMILRAHDPARFIYLVLEGGVKEVQVTPEGKEVILSLHGPGDLFGELASFHNGEAPASAVAMAASRLLQVPREEWQRMVESNPQLQRSLQVLRENHGAQIRVSEAQALVRAARLYLYDSVAQLWKTLLKTGNAPIEARADVRMAASHAVFGAAKAVDLAYAAAGATALYTNFPLERAFRDVHAITQHIGVHPRVMETTGRVLFGLEPDTPLL